jgi:methyl-accepting chemotaxis protein
VTTECIARIHHGKISRDATRHVPCVGPPTCPATIGSPSALQSNLNPFLLPSGRIRSQFMIRLWHAIRQPRLAIRLQMITATALICLIALGGLAVSDIYRTMLNARVDKLRAITDEAVSIAVQLQHDVEGGKLSREQAIERYRDAIRPIRYDGGSGYYFAYGMDGTTLVLGPTPNVEGTNRDDIKDSDGKRFVHEMIELTHQGSGTVLYRYPKPGSAGPQPKLAYVAPVPGWNMLVGTGLYVDDLRAAMMASALELSAIGSGMLLVCVLTAWVVSRGITGPLSGLRHCMASLAGGDLNVSITGTDRRDEAGHMAGAVQVFKEHMLKEQRLAAEQEEQRERADAEKHAALVEMADKIEQQTSVALREVSAHTAKMTATAEQMSASAARTGQSALAASTTSAQALENAQTVASAAEELAASIREIGSQVAQSNIVVGRAVTAGGEARTTIEALNEEVTRIGVVADMIGEIAAKTNLLALNATIEAARAGDAGKGFAVVASEVKTLATQTARSTEEIGKHIAQVSNATGASVAAVVRIEQTISEVSSIASSIAAAVEEQQAATAEIARNVNETAVAANEMTSRASEVSAEAENTAEHAADVRESALGLNTAVGDLRHSVIEVVRTSTAEVDRRRVSRRNVDLPCRVTDGGKAYAARVIDISERGAAIRGAPLMQPGARVALHIDAVSHALPCIIRDSDDDTMHVSFELDATGSAKLKPIVESLSERRAA